MLYNEKILLGIDLGTSTSSCCFFDPYSQKPTIIPFTNNEKDEFFFYSRAVIKSNKIIINPNNNELYTGDVDIVSNKSNIDSRKARIKYTYKDKKNDEILKTKFSPYDVHVEFLRYIREKAIKYLFNYLNQFVDISISDIENAFSTAVIGVPQDWGIMGRDNLVSAAKDAGFKNIQLVDEQISSILYYYSELANDMSEEEKDILVFDLGGGTLDISYVSKKKNNYDVLFSDGDEHFGGDDFDWEIVFLIIDKMNLELKNNKTKQSFFIDKITKKLSFKKDENTNIEKISNFTTILKEQVRIFKENNINSDKDLYTFFFNQSESGMKRLDEIFYDECKIKFPFEHISFTKEEINSYFAPLFDKLVKIGKKLYNEIANNSDLNFENILFVGGACKFNLLREIIMQRLIIANEFTTKNYNPSLAVVYGTVVGDLRKIITNDLLGSSWYIVNEYEKITNYFPAISLHDFALKKPVIAVFESNQKIWDRKNHAVISDHVIRNKKIKIDITKTMEVLLCKLDKHDPKQNVISPKNYYLDNELVYLQETKYLNISSQNSYKIDLTQLLWNKYKIEQWTYVFLEFYLTDDYDKKIHCKLISPDGTKEKNIDYILNPKN